MIYVLQAHNTTGTRKCISFYLLYIYCFFVPVVAVVTVTDQATQVSCDFSDDHGCGYTVGGCWASTPISFFDSSGNERAVVKFCRVIILLLHAAIAKIQSMCCNITVISSATTFRHNGVNV